MLSVLLLSALGVCGCAHNKADLPPAGASVSAQVNASSPDQKLIITPETGLVGRVVKVNPGARFVVLSFPVGHLPAQEQRLNLYRLGLKVGELRVTGPQLDDNVVADVLVGDAQVGDEVRDR